MGASGSAFGGIASGPVGQAVGQVWVWQLQEAFLNLLGVALVAEALTYFAFGLAAGLLPRGDRPPGEPGLAGRFRQVKVWHLGLAVVLVALVLGGPFFWITNLIVVATAGGWLLLARAWLRECRYLMALGDSDFPGRHDKLIWIFFLVALAPAGVWLFRSYRLARRPEPAPSPGADGEASPVGEALGRAV